MLFRPQPFIATTLFGLEQVLAAELEELGALNVEARNRAVAFEGDKKLIYQANLQLRTALRILKPLHRFKARNEHELYRGVQQIEWHRHLGNDDTLAVDAAVGSDFFNHSQYVALKTKDAIVDQFRERTGERPSVETERPTLRINVHIQQDEVNISLDSSGDPLYKRGYRVLTGLAPLNEVLAAGMIKLSGWKANRPFIDPMCGSGTLLIEAAMIALNIAPGLHREHFGFETWRDFDSQLWEQVREEAIAQIVEFNHPIIGSDASYKSVVMAQRNLEAAQVEEYVQVFEKRFEDQEPPPGPGILMINPPYGERLEADSDIVAFYKTIGDRLKQAYTGYDAWILTSNLEALKHLGLRPSRKIPLYNGPLECRFAKFELYRGTKKVHKLQQPGEGEE